MQYSLFDGVGNPNEEALRAFNHPLNVVPQQHNPAALTGDA